MEFTLIYNLNRSYVKRMSNIWRVVIIEIMYVKNIHSMLKVLIIFALAFPHLSSTQDSTLVKVAYEVNKVVPYISITKENLTKVHSLIDLNYRYESEWVKEYKSVEIRASYNGNTKKAESCNNVLSQEQKDILNMADLGKEIKVSVLYIPENTLPDNDVKEMKFSISVVPESEATYPGGQQQLRKYLAESAINKISEGTLEGYDLAAVKFVIDEQGQVVDAHIFESASQMLENVALDKLLLESICNMPTWKPAEFANGVKVKQEFVLTVGNMSSCLIPLLSIRQY